MLIAVRQSRPLTDQASFRYTFFAGIAHLTIGDVDYFWPPLEPSLLPGNGIKQLAKKYEAHGPYEFYIAGVWGRQEEHDWLTGSWLEVAYSSTGRVSLVI